MSTLLNSNSKERQYSLLTMYPKDKAEVRPFWEWHCEEIRHGVYVFLIFSTFFFFTSLITYILDRTDINFWMTISCLIYGSGYWLIWLIGRKYKKLVIYLLPLGYFIANIANIISAD